MGATILFVEDNDDLRINATMVLDLEGYEVRAARDGQEALEMLMDGLVPHLIVSDIMMPRMDGYQFFEAVRQQEHLRGVPFIFLTARGSRRDIITGRSLGADDYLVKPFDPEEFLIAVRNKLQRAEEIRAQASHSLANARKTLVQMLSHELRTPLTFVTGGFALLAEELENQGSTERSDDIRVSLDLILSGSQRLNRLAEQMVLYSELLSGVIDQQVSERSEDLVLSYLISDAVTPIDSLILERSSTFRISDPGERDYLLVRGVKDLLVTAISEVLRNAVRFAPEQSRVDIISAREEDFAVLTIRDRGQGIPPEYQQHIWDVMVQLGRDRSEQPGTGMGLPIVKGIITAHHGAVYLFSEPGRGTDVTLRIPLAR